MYRSVSSSFENAQITAQARIISEWAPPTKAKEKTDDGTTYPVG
jgi:hypothetical protein